MDPVSIPKYATPLLIPPVMPRAGVVNLKGGKQADYYEISMRQISQQITFMNGMHSPTDVALVPGTNRPPEPWESGFKDTVIAYPGEVTRVKAQFTNPGQFVWHCHIVSHEDNEMMRPFRIGPPQPGEPQPKTPMQPM